MICGNKNCNNKFYRVKHAVLDHNFCSKSCAAIINNQKYPKYPLRPCKNPTCTKMHRRTGSFYCSLECSRSFAYKERFTYTKEEIILAIQKATKELGRPPAKRELKHISDKCAGMFGSWNNAVLAAGLEPHRSDDHRMYKRTRTKAHDGHICDSVSEAIIDNWLSKNNISHTRNAKYPSTNHKADWGIGDGKIFVEYFGLAKDSPRYDREVKVKKNICRKHRIKLVEIYPSDLYPIMALDRKFRTITL